MKFAERGVAVVMAMGVVALAATAATAILVSQSTWARRAELAAEQAQAQEILQAGSAWVRAMLGDDARSSSVDHPGELWAQRLPPIPIENGELAGHIDDQQGLFNLNNLVTAGKLNLAQYARFGRLLSTLGLPGGLADTLADWIDADSQPQPRGGAEDDYYLAQDPPYRSGNRPLTDVDELAWVRGFDPGVRARLAPFVTALPAPSAVNVNTAPPEVLSALVDGLGLDAARILAARRATVWFRDTADFRARLANTVSEAATAGVAVPDQDIRVASDYFLATLRVTRGGAEARGQLLLARLDAARWPVVVWSKVQ